MSSCCPPPKKIVIGGIGEVVLSSIYDAGGVPPGANAECATGNAPMVKEEPGQISLDSPNKIANTSIVPNVSSTKDVSVDVTFKMTNGSTRTPSSWTLKQDSAAWDSTSTGVTWAPPRLSGTFKKEYLGKSFTITVAAIDATGEIDSRAFTFSPAAGSSATSAKLTHPLPGSILTSPYGERVVNGVAGKHRGLDFSGVSAGSVILAAADGVARPGSEPVGGNYVTISHYDGAGKLICSTTYRHLNKSLVTNGQKVSAGQTIGEYGNSGAHTTGAHLHFELELPNGTRIDPLPYIAGSIKMTDQSKLRIQNRAGTAQDTSKPEYMFSFGGGGEDKTPTITVMQQGGPLTRENVNAKMAACSKPGSGAAPSPPTEAAPAAGAPSTSAIGLAKELGASLSDAFEAAWKITMRTETGMKKGAIPPDNPDVLRGDISTKQNQWLTGWNMDSGGTKFGIAQAYNTVKVIDITYEQARNIGYSVYWAKSGCKAMAASGKPLSAIAAFNLGYLCGTGGMNNSILPKVDLKSLSDKDAALKICDVSGDYLNNKADQSPAKARNRKGWANRVSEVRDFIKSLSP